MIRTCVCAVVFLSAASAFASETLTVGKLKAGQQIDLHTQDANYRATLLTPSTGECRMHIVDGERSSAPRTVFLIGATKGQQDGLSLVQMGEVKVGFKIELGLDDLAEANRAHTTSVVRFALLP